MKNKIKLKTAISICVSSLLLFTTSAQATTIDCSDFDQWVAQDTYTAGQKVKAQGQGFEAKWWNQTDPVQKSGPWQEWKKLFHRSEHKSMLL